MPLHPGPALGGVGLNWEQFRSAQVPSQLVPRSVELGAGPNWEQLVHLALRPALTAPSSLSLPTPFSLTSNRSTTEY